MEELRTTPSGGQFRLQRSTVAGADSCQISVACSSTADFEISRENSFDRFAKKLALTAGRQTGDSDFDRQFFVGTDNLDLTREQLAGSTARDAIRALFTLGANYVSHDGSALRALFRSPAPDLAVEAAAEQLFILQAALRQQASSRLDFWGIHRSGKRALLVGANLLLLLAALLLRTVAHTRFPILDDGWNVVLFSFVYGVPAALAAIAGQAIFLRGSSAAHYELLRLSPLTIFAVLIFFYYGIKLANGVYTKGPAQPIAAIVSTKSSVGGLPVARLTSRQWHGEKDLLVTTEEFDGIHPGLTTATVYLRPGAFGYHWLAGRTLHSIKSHPVLR